MRRRRDAGVILVNVLVALALAAALVTLMLTSQEGAIDRARRASAAAQAEALALAGEASVLVALRRDMAEAPESDALSEPWALVVQEEVELASGRFAVTVSDAQARLDVNGLLGGGVVQAAALGALVAALDLPPETAGLIADGVRRDGPLTDLGQIEGLDGVTRASLEPFLDALPAPASVNLNSADPLLMGALLGSQSAARRLGQLRDRQGAIDSQDLLDLGLVPAAGTGFRSDTWDVTTLAEVDGVEITLRSRLLRRRGVGREEVVVVARRFGARTGELPPLPAAAP